MSTSQFSSIGEESGGGLNIEAEVSGRPGVIELSAEASGAISVGALALSAPFEGDEDTVTITATLENVQEVRSTIRNRLNAIESAVQTIPVNFPTNPLSQLPNRLRRGVNSSGYVTPVEFGDRELGPSDDNATLNRTFDFEPVTIPSLEGLEQLENVSDIPTIAELPDIQVRFQARPSGTVNRFLGPSPTVTLPLSSRAFFREESLGRLNCDQIFNEIDERLTQLDSATQGALEEIRGRAGEMRNIRREIGSQAGTGSDVDSLRDVSPGDVLGAGRDRLERLQGRVDQINTRDVGDFDFLGRGTNTLSDLRSEASDLRDRIEDVPSIPGLNCADEFSNRLNNSFDRISEMDDLFRRINESKDVLNDVLEGVEGADCADIHPDIAEQVRQLEQLRIPDQISGDPLEERRSRLNTVENNIERVLSRDPACRDRFESQINEVRANLEDAAGAGPGDRVTRIPNRLLTAVSSFERDVRDFLDLDRLERQPDRRDRIVSEGEQIRARIRSSDDLSESQKNRLLSRVNEPLSRIRGAGVRTPEALPCSSRFSSLDDDIDEFRNRVSRLSAPVRPQQLQRVVRQGENIVQKIERETGDAPQCTRRFSSEVRALIQRAQGLTARVRVETQTEEQARQRSEQLIEELLSDLQDVETNIQV